MVRKIIQVITYHGNTDTWFQPKDLPKLGKDLHTIYCHLYHMDVLSHLREHQLRSMCTSARYERHEANHVLFYPDSIATCWYILLSGSV
ncbi:rap guanine nucleotide exchange factor 6 isoform X1, partial [Lates japonicus]